MDNPRTLHGETLQPYRKITIINAVSRRRTGQIFSASAVVGDEVLQEETVEGAYAIVGAHITNEDAIFPSVRFRIVRQDAWANLSGLMMEHGIDGPNKGQVAIRYTLPDRLTVPLAGESGTVSLVPEAVVSPPRVAGAYILTKTWFEVEAANGVTVRSASTKFITSASSLLTMLFAKDCPPSAFEVKDPDSRRWCSVYMPGFALDSTDVWSPKADDRPLMTREELGLESIALWFSVVERLTPLPQMIANSVDAGDRTVQNLLLELATAAEGVHRRLYPDRRVLSDEERDQALKAIDGLDVVASARQALHNAMRTYLWEPSYPQRIKALAADVAAVVPGVTGKTSRWSNAIVNARIGFAHGMTRSSSEDEIITFHILHGSLRWLLTARLLLEAGISPNDLSTSFARFERYSQFLRQSRRSLPRIYGDETK
ncbi:hypothetical protein Pth03_11980 [Planotetraspora thailandica]|uniref:ApeA N-terminal domain-containing protein n=2 Tax=Planotetraspora thailandica TaxID=487172 RepID=A0A8J3UVK5_9ACTN|nr:hypothetical protein Pth03_11980 [Planotetraspora thailandica]